MLYVVTCPHVRPDRQKDHAVFYPSRGTQTSFRPLPMPPNQRDERGEKDHLSPTFRLTASNMRYNWNTLSGNPSLIHRKSLNRCYTRQQRIPSPWSATEPNTATATRCTGPRTRAGVVVRPSRTVFGAVPSVIAGTVDLLGSCA